MENVFEKREISCLETVLQEIQTQEQTQELRIPEGMPPADSILGAWGQCILRSKQWQNDSAEASVGMMVKVAYLPEGGGSPQSVECWIPFRLNWDMPTGEEGKLRLLCLPRFVDARLLSGEKMMIRAGISALAEGYRDGITQVYGPKETEEDVQLLQHSYLMRLPVEMGEKTFSVEEELSVPASVPKPGKVISCLLEPEVTDRKVLSERLVFRGNARAHMLYESEEGQLASWDFDLPFSQFVPLEESRSQDAQADIWPGVTELEVETDPEGKVHLSAGITAQYLVDDRQKLTLTEDAYSNLREITARREQLQLPVVLENRRELVNLEQTVPVGADVVVDTVVMTEFPRQNRQGDDLILEVQGICQLICAGPGGTLRGSSHRFRGSHRMNTHANARMLAIPGTVPAARVHTGSEDLTLQLQIPMDLTVTAGQGMDMVTGLETGELRQPDPARPSLVLTRANGADLWALARESGSTVEAIRTANGLEGEPEPGRMLLIPVL